MAAIHITTAWDAASKQLVIAESTKKGLGGIKAARREVFHDMLVQSIPKNTDVFVTHPDKSLFRLRDGQPASRL